MPDFASTVSGLPVAKAPEASSPENARLEEQIRILTRSIEWHEERAAALETEVAVEIERSKQIEAGLTTEREANKLLGVALDELQQRLETQVRLNALLLKTLEGWELRHGRTPEGQLEGVTRALLAQHKKPEPR